MSHPPDERKIVVADAGPLIALARIGRLDLLRELYLHVAVPPRVLLELRLRESRPGSRGLRRAVSEGWIEELTPEDTSDLEQLTQVVDPGEAEAILLAMREDVRFLLIDDRRGRQIARARGLTIVGTGVVLLAAKRRGLVEGIAPVLADLTRAGYHFSPRLQRRLLELAGETEPPSRRPAAAPRPGPR